MRRLLLTVLLTGLFAGGGLAIAPTAQACSCAETDTAQHFADADVVFSGVLLSRVVDHPGWPMTSSGDPALHIFSTQAVYKGEVHERQGVVSAADGASCGLELRGDGPFVVYASRDPDLPEGQYRAGLCSGTGTLDAAVAAELQDLTALTTPAGTPGALPTTGAAGVQVGGLGPVAIAGIGAGSLGGVALAWLLWHRLRRSAAR